MGIPGHDNNWRRTAGRNGGSSYDKGDDRVSGEVRDLQDFSCPGWEMSMWKNYGLLVFK